MIKNIMRLLMLSSLIALGFSLKNVMEYWQYEEATPDIDALMQTPDAAFKVQQQIETAIKEANFDEATMLIELARSYHYSLNYKAYETAIREKNTVFRQTIQGIGDFTGGFFSGTGENSTAVAGAVTADFTVVGDVRDLYKQYKIHDAGNEVDTFIVTLAGVGIGLTAITIGSGGSAAPVKAGVSTLKLAGKTQKITKSFRKIVVDKATKVFNWDLFSRQAKKDVSFSGLKRAATHAYNPRAVKSLTQITDRANNIRKATSISDTLYLFRFVENTKDLKRVEKVSLKYGARTKGIFKTLGKAAIRGGKILIKTAALLLSLLYSLFSGAFFLYSLTKSF